MFIRVRPGEVDDVLPAAALKPVPVAAGDFRRASDFFDDSIGQTFNLDLRDLSRDRWSLIPTIGDLLAEVRTRRLGTLTYARSTKDAEDISLFDRRRRRNIAVYASAQKLASRGRFYGEDELVDYDVLRQDVEVAFSPDRMWIEGTATLEVRVRTFALATLTLRLAESLAVRSVVAGDYGRLLHLRVVGQNSVLVNLPATVQRNGIIRFTVVYGGRLEPQQIEREGIVLDQQSNTQQEEVYIPIEPQYIYSNRSYWYPQNTVTDYAISRLRVSVPAEFDVVASGVESAPPAAAPGPVPPGQRARKLFVFEAAQPLRYLACVISRFTRVTTRDLLIGAESDPVGAKPVKLTVQANPRQATRARAFADRAAAIYEYYGRLIGDAPYPAFTLAVTENDLPGGHSPAYFAILNQPLPLSPIVWRNDPVAFDGYPPYFLAHEIAHQWWGQAIGWKNYHEQWISEGFAQYFAALYASAGSRRRGLPRHAAADAPLVDRAVGARARSISATGSATSRLKDASSAPSSTTRGRWSCTCCGAWSATRSSSRESGSSTRRGGSARPAPTTSAWRCRRRAARISRRSSTAGSTAPASRCSRSRQRSAAARRGYGSSTAAPSCRRR